MSKATRREANDLFDCKNVSYLEHTIQLLRRKFQHLFQLTFVFVGKRFPLLLSERRDLGKESGQYLCQKIRVESIDS